MNGPAQSPTTQDPTLRALVERGLAQAQAREEAIEAIEGPPVVVEPPAETVAPSPRTLGLTSDRACLETNLARKGLWRSASGAAAEGGELVRLLDAPDQLGTVQRIDSGPPLDGLAFDVIVWTCTRWRELGAGGERHVSFTLEAMAADLGWRKGGGAAAELGRALDTLRTATFRARVYNARLQETRIDTFGLIDRWECETKAPGRSEEVLLGVFLAEAEASGPAAVEALRALDAHFAFAVELVTARRAAKMTQTRLSELSGIPRSEISRFERGQGNPTLETIGRLLGSLDRQVPRHRARRSDSRLET
jgi:DNA-binding XRE family transcriptional regulator